MLHSAPGKFSSALHISLKQLHTSGPFPRGSVTLITTGGGLTPPSHSDVTLDIVSISQLFKNICAQTDWNQRARFRVHSLHRASLKGFLEDPWPKIPEEMILLPP